MADSYFEGLENLESKYFYNFTTGKVEKGQQSPASELAGPYDTEAEALAAPEAIAARNAAWDAEDAEEDNWGEPAAYNETDVVDAAEHAVSSKKAHGTAADAADLADVDPAGTACDCDCKKVDVSTDDLAGAPVDELPVAED